MGKDLPTLAIAGATGRLGKYIANACLGASTRSRFSKIILLSRKPASSSAQLSEWQDLGAVIRGYDEDDLSKALTDVDVLINAIGTSGYQFRDAIVRSLPKTPIYLYLPSEFGCDHTTHDFPHPEWDHKKQHFELAKHLAPKIRICRVFIGLFTEESIGPWFGFHTVKDEYECIGSAGTATTYTSLVDVGKAAASLAATKPKDVPEKIHIAGDTLSVRVIATLMHEAGAGSIAVKEIDLKDFKAETLAAPNTDPANYLRFLMGENKINHTTGALGNDNELVNPRESLWKWQKMADYAKGTKGRPWSNEY